VWMSTIVMLTDWDAFYASKYDTGVAVTLYEYLKRVIEKSQKNSDTANCSEWNAETYCECLDPGGVASDCPTTRRPTSHLPQVARSYGDSASAVDGDARD
jgi:hypothetical protein